MKSGKRLLLFDIDGTLIDSGGAGLVALEAGFFDAFPQLVGQAFPSLDLGGATDRGVAAFLFEQFDLVASEENHERFFDSYHDRLRQVLSEFESQGKGRLLSGVQPLLDALAAREDRFHLGLLTGNTESGARIKLGHFGIDHHFSAGAFGSDHADRNQLGPIAKQRWEAQSGVEFSPEDVLVVGDTPKDIACARAFGARVLAVSTGVSSESELKAATPDAFFPNFEDTSAVLRTLDSL